MGNSNKRKDETLGMPHGTANHHLRKAILFNQLQKHNENICIRCGQIIESQNNLSIEHIKPWEGISAKLFWDLDNIAFSHLKCNLVERNSRYEYPIKIVNAIGQIRCSDCKQFKYPNEFHNNESKSTKKNTECKDCKSNRNAKRDRRFKRLSDNGSPSLCQGESEGSNFPLAAPYS